MVDVAALYVDESPRGVYTRMPGVEVWGVSRDARLYDGPHPVVCHPPCQLWINMAGVNFRRYGGSHNRPGNDGGCFARALECVRECGGVLEHPAGSLAWKTFCLQAPLGVGWMQTGPRQWTCEVWQSAYGCRARKRTWLLYVGAERPLELDWARAPGTHQVGWFDRRKPTLSKREGSATPTRFAEALIDLARHSARKARCA